MAIYIRAGDRQGKVRSGEMGGVTWNQPSGLSFNFLGTALPYPMVLTRRSESWIMEERLEVAARMSSSTSDNSHFNLEQRNSSPPAPPTSTWSNETAHHQPLPLQPGATKQLTTSHSHFNLEQRNSSPPAPPTSTWSNETAHHQPLPLQPGRKNSLPPAPPTSTWSKHQLTTSPTHLNLERITAHNQFSPGLVTKHSKRSDRIPTLTRPTVME